jgi:hypothetical protein
MVIVGSMSGYHPITLSRQQARNRRGWLSSSLVIANSGLKSMTGINFAVVLSRIIHPV